ncbi:hypothetical protein B1B_03348 [mine drainage metagenome]|uniref:PKD domain-containing protein n=1 Tax=mine drainage metagenome TaxID=410659 RepID=T1CU78_9ZZZZ
MNVSLSRTSLDVGETVDLVAEASGGAGGYRFAWQALPPGCAGTGAIVACVPTGPGLFDLRVTVTDAEGYSAVSPQAVALSVWPALNATVTVAPTAPTVGAPTEFGIQLTGGARPITVAWEFPGDHFETGLDANFTFAASGVNLVSVWVNDSTGASLLRIQSVQVEPRATVPAASPWLVVGPIVGVVAAGAVLAVGLFARRRPPRPASAAGSTGPPTADAPDAPRLYG